MRPPLAPTPPATPASRGPGVQARVTLVLFGTALVLVATMLAAQLAQEQQVSELFRERAAESGRAFARILEARSNTPALHADDYSRWDEFVDFVRTHDPKWADINLTQGIPTFKLDAAWVLDAQFHHIYTANPKRDPLYEMLPLTTAEFAVALTRKQTSHFFTMTPRGPLEVWTNSIVPTTDLAHATPARGYYVIAKLWTPARLRELAMFADGQVRVRAAAGFREGTRGWPQGGYIEVRKALPGVDGRPVAGLEFLSRFEIAQRVTAALWRSSLLAMLGALLSLIAVWTAMAHWVGGPLAAITRAMRHEDPAALAGVRARRDELGEVAGLVDAFFEQRDSLIEARKAAEAAAMAKSHFLANISHELRTPMHGILSFSRFGLRDAETATRADLRDNFRQINECGESLLLLLNALLDLSKLEAGRMPFSFSDVALADVVDVALDEFRSFYHERQIVLTAAVEPHLPTVVADRARLVQVLRNLVSNAAKFTPAGGTVTVRVEAAGTLQRVVVDDSGMGIPTGEEELIFRKFTQASHTSPRTGGTGLGLAICREIIEAHEGRVWAENRAGGGARLIVEIPLAGPAAAHAPAASEPESAPVPAPAGVAPRAAIATAASANARWKKVA